MIMKTEDLIAYWKESSEIDFQTMLHLMEKGDYTWALFIGHLVIEKLLKAFYAKTHQEHPPLIHDLVTLAERSHLTLSEDYKDKLDTISTFNIRARYDDYKMAFYKKCTKDFTERWVQEIKDIRKWIKNKL